MIYLLVVVPLLVSQGLGYYFEEGYEHHYTYTSESNVLGTPNLTVIMKVGSYLG